MKELIAEVRPLEGFTFARLEGEIDLSNAAEFGEALAEAIDGSSAGLIVDFSAVAYMDSAGVRALFDGVRQLESRRQALAMVVPETSAVRTLIKVTNLHEAIPVCESAEECATALSLAEGNGR
jgi:anti-sigma B factor antagonist